jgi:hypothetical protein
MNQRNIRMQSDIDLKIALAAESRYIGIDKKRRSQ